MSAMLDRTPRPDRRQRGYRHRVDKVREDQSASYGYNTATDCHEELVANGVIYLTKVTRWALQNAASIAGLMLTTEAMIAEIPEKKAAPAGGPVPRWATKL